MIHQEHEGGKYLSLIYILELWLLPRKLLLTDV